MKRSDIIRTVQVNFKRMRMRDAAAVVDTIIESMIDAVASGNRIEIRGFGTFQPQRRLRTPQVFKSLQGRKPRGQSEVATKVPGPVQMAYMDHMWRLALGPVRLCVRHDHKI